ncbi:hypothetical protein ACFUN8_36740 [Streptomyces sp. NPDC057307]|uniref:hypothetical protein n=1 Tax=Streptomyces sp. NPDC057307 TaxID=3346096 RepID=UPI00362DE0D2
MTTAGDVIGEFISAQLDVVRARRASLEARGLAVITSSGALVTLQLALVTLLPQAPEAPHPAGRALIAASTVSFLAATIGGVFSNLPRKAFHVSPQSLLPHISPDFWDASEKEARKAITTIQLKVLISAERTTRVKARTVLISFCCEMAGISCLTAAVMLTLLRP